MFRKLAAISHGRLLSTSIHQLDSNGSSLPDAVIIVESVIGCDNEPLNHEIWLFAISKLPLVVTRSNNTVGSSLALPSPLAVPTLLSSHATPDTTMTTARDMATSTKRRRKKSLPRKTQPKSPRTRASLKKAEKKRRALLKTLIKRMRQRMIPTTKETPNPRKKARKKNPRNPRTSPRNLAALRCPTKA